MTTEDQTQPSSRLLPYDAVAEMCVLGSIIIDCTRAMYVCKQAGIKGEAFYQPQARSIYEAMEAMVLAGKHVDLTTLNAHLKSTCMLDRVGGYNVLEQLVDKTPSAAHVEHYASIVCEKWSRRRIIHQCRLTEAEAFEEDSDVSSIVGEAQIALGDVNARNELDIKTLRDMKDHCFQKWEKAKTTGIVGFPFVLPTLSNWWGGMRPGVMSILGAYRGEGKSTLARQDALATAWAHGIPTAVLSMEDPSEIAHSRIAGCHSRVSAFDLDRGTASQEAAAKMLAGWNEIQDIPLYIVAGSMDIGKIVATVNILVSKFGVKKIYFDHFQKIMPYTLPHKSRNDTVAEYSGITCGLVEKLDIHICAVSQLSRGPEKENRPPRLSDIRDSGTLEQDARQIMLLHWDGEQHIIHNAKNNFGESGGKLKVRRIGSEQRFFEMDRPEAEGE